MSTDIVIVQPDTAPIAAEIVPIVARAQALVINSPQTHGAALELAQACRKGERKIDELFEPGRKALDQGKKDHLRVRDELKSGYITARGIIEKRDDEYVREETRKAEAESRRLATLARAAEEERHIEAAIQAEAEGQDAEAEAILDEPVMAPVVTVAPAVAAVEGVGATTRWHAEITDLLALVRHVAGHPEWIALLEPAMPALNGLARSQHGALSLPGVRAVAETVRSYR